MVRNEADIIVPFIRQLSCLFDDVIIVDINSTDGTREIINKNIYKNKKDENIEVFTCKTIEKYQSSLMNLLSRRLFDKGNNWCFLLDADEFLSFQSKAELVDVLTQSESDVVGFSWINLVPTEFGEYENFNIDQEFEYINSDTKVYKIAISSKVKLKYPDYYVVEGNHGVLESFNGHEIDFEPIANLYHIPIRSKDRFEYKINNAKKYLDSKKNKKILEGMHVVDFAEKIRSSSITDEHLRSFAVSYSLDKKLDLNWKFEQKKWEKLRVPKYLANAELLDTNDKIGLLKTIEYDNSLDWIKVKTFKNRRLSSRLRKGSKEINVGIQPLINNIGFYGRFQSIDENGVIDIDLMVPDVLNYLLDECIDTLQTLKSEEISIVVLSSILVFLLIKPYRAVSICSGNYELMNGICAASKTLETIGQKILINNFIEYGKQRLIKNEYEYVLNMNIIEALEYFDENSVELFTIDCEKIYDTNEMGCLLNLISCKLVHNGLIMFVHVNDNNKEFINNDNNFKEVFSLHDIFIVQYKKNITNISADITNESLISLGNLVISKYANILVKKRLKKDIVINLIDNTKILILKSRYRSVLIALLKPIYQSWKNAIKTVQQQFQNTLKIIGVSKLKYISYDIFFEPKYNKEGMKEIRLVIPTRGCSSWILPFIKKYEEMGLRPTYIIDSGCEHETLQILKKIGAEYIYIDKTDIKNGESLMPYLSKHIKEEYILRLDDDEFPSRQLINWISNIPNSDYSIVDSWWLPRDEVAYLNGTLVTYHPNHLRVKVGDKKYENLHGGRFYRHKEVKYDHVGPHHGNFISEYVSHAPHKAKIYHLDYLLRTPQQRLEKIRAVENKFKGSGWIFANLVIPEIAPEGAQRVEPFMDSGIDDLIAIIMKEKDNLDETLNLKVSEIREIQRDRLTSTHVHKHY